MNANEKCIAITIGLLLVALIVIVLQNAEKIDGQETLREVVLIVLDAGDGKFLDYQLYKTKFLPRY